MLHLVSFPKRDSAASYLSQRSFGPRSVASGRDSVRPDDRCEVSPTGISEIELANGRGVVLVNAEDFEWLSQWQWHLKQVRNGRAYAIRVSVESGRREAIRMHRLILNLSDKSMLVDHVDGNGLNNQRSNLRVATNRQNQWNLFRRSGNTSGFKGVTWKTDRQRWRASIKINGRDVDLCVTESKEEAALAYDAAARIHFGEFARLNFPLEGERAA